MKSCKECGNERCLLNATEGYCLDCPECGVNWKEKKMEFDKSRVYTALNADELKAGDKVIVADQLSVLKQRVQKAKENSAVVLHKINGEDWDRRFGFKMSDYALAYLVERAENCTNCVHREGEGCKPNVSPVNCCPCYDREVKQSYIEPKTETPELISLGNGQYAERKHYRPFRDTDELIKVWLDKGSKWQKREITMPLIWVRRKDCNCKGQLITKFSDPLWVIMSTEGYNMTDLFVHFTFLDGSPCGVEE